MSSSSDQAQGMSTKGSDADAAGSAEPPAKAEGSASSSSSSGAKVANGDAERAPSASASTSSLSSTTPASPSLTISTFDDAESSANQPPTSTMGGASLRQPAPIRPGDGLSPSASPSYAPHKHHHQRSRSVNLSPVMRVGSFVPPPSSPKGAPGGINLNLAWEHHWPPQASGSGSSGASSSSSGSGSGSNAAAQHHVANGMDPRHRAASPLNLGGPLKVPATRPASADSGHSFPPHFDRHLHSRSPETSTQARRGIHASSSTNRNASPARVWAMPVSPRLKAFGSDRMRRSSSSSSSGSNSSSSSGDKALHTSSSPPNRPASPVPGPINPDPEHAFDSIWPSDAAVASSSPSSPQRHRGELLHNWMMDRRRSESRSPHADAQRSIPPRSAFSSSPGSAGSASPILMRGGGPFGGHRKSLSGSSSSSSASPTIAVSMLEPPAPSSTPPPGSLGLHRSASNPGFNGALAAPPRGSPVSRFISPTTSSIKLDAQSVLAQVTPSGESPPTSPRSPRSPSSQLPSGSGSGISESLAYPQRRGSLNNGRPRSLGPSDASPTSPSGFVGSPSFARSPSPFAKSSGSGTSPTPTPPPITSESPPKTRSFIGMPPRSGYELSDDPDDVGSEDGTSSSVSSGGKEDSTSQTTDDDDEERRVARHEDDEDEERDDLEEQGRETEAFEADEEDALANERRKENGEHEQQPSGEVTSAPSSSTLRPNLPKRPSLTRSSAVPSMPPTPPAQPTSALRHFDLGLASANDASMWHHPPTENADNAPPADANDSLLDGITIPPPDPAEAQRPTADSQPIASAVLAAMEGDDHDEEGEGNEGEGEDGEEAPGGTAGAATEESLSTLERIFLFAKSEMTYHRIIVSRSLPMWIREVELTEAVEYVIALLNGLATDDVDVCTAFAGELDQILWFFFLNCPLAESDALGGEDDDETKATRPRLPVGVFTPLICALLLNQNATVAQTAQTALVQFFQRLNAAAAADDTDGLVRHAAGREGELVEYEQYRLDDEVKRMVANELLEHVAFAMGRQSRDEGASNNDASDAGKPAENGVSTTAGNEAVDEPLGQRVDEMQPHSATDGDEDSSWDAEMREDGDIDIGGLAADDWRKISSPFDSSSPVFEAYERADIDEEAAVGRMASVSLIGALSSESDAVSSSTVSQRFLPEVLALHEDPAFYVRKEVAMALGPISKHLDEEQVLQTLVPCFEALCSDKIWHVRQAATTSLPAIFGRLTGQQRRDAVVKLMRGFSRDVSRNVRATALEIIGEAIYLFHGDEGGVPAELVRFFLGEPFDIEEEDDSRGAPANNSENQDGSEGSFLFADFDFASAMNGGAQTAKQSSTPGNGSIETGPTVSWERPDYSAAFDDADRPLVMAYNFPAVVLTLGGDASWPRLRSAHNRLILDGAPKVRQSLAASLHEIAKLVGEETVRDDLVPVFERLVATDEESEVKAALLENANVLLSRAPRDVALHQLSLLRDLWSTSFSTDWRLREAMALQVPLLADTFVGIDDEGCLMSIMQAALCDAISSVRDAGVKAVPALYRNFVLQHDQTIADGVLGMLSDMGEARSYRVRVGFLRAVEALVRVGEDGEEEEENRGGRLNAASFRLIVLPRLLELVNDHVIDVRLALSSLATAICHRHHEADRANDADGEGGFSRSPRKVDLLRTLSRDWSLEVRQPVLNVLALMFGQDDPISKCGEGEENERVPRSRSELVLGPANGGPHRPPPSENGGNGDAGTLTTMMDFDQEGEDDDDEGRGSDEDGDEDQHRAEPFQMDEDDQESQPYNSLQQRQRRSRHRSHQINGHRGFEEEEDDEDDDGMADDLLDSDLEMVNLDDAAEHRGDEGEDVGDATMNDDRSGGSGSGSSGDGNALGLETPSAADDSFSSSDSGDAGAGAAEDVMYLTSPERPRDAWNGQYFGSVAPGGEEEGKHLVKDDVERRDERDGSDGSDDGEEQDETKPSSTDPFLSFVSSNLGGGGAKKGRKFKRHKSSEAVPKEDDGGAGEGEGEGEGEAAAGVEEKEGA